MGYKGRQRGSAWKIETCQSCGGRGERPDASMRRLKTRRTSIQCIAHPEWGSFGVMEDRGSYYEIAGRSGRRVLEKEEAARHWRQVQP